MVDYPDSFDAWGASLCWGDEAFPQSFAQVPPQATGSASRKTAAAAIAELLEPDTNSSPSQPHSTIEGKLSSQSAAFAVPGSRPSALLTTALDTGPASLSSSSALSEALAASPSRRCCQRSIRGALLLAPLWAHITTQDSLDHEASSKYDFPWSAAHGADSGEAAENPALGAAYDRSSSSSSVAPAPAAIGMHLPDSVVDLIDDADATMVYHADSEATRAYSGAASGHRRISSFSASDLARGSAFDTGRGSAIGSVSKPLVRKVLLTSESLEDSSTLTYQAYLGQSPSAFLHNVGSQAGSWRYLSRGVGSGGDRVEQEEGGGDATLKYEPCTPESAFCGLARASLSENQKKEAVDWQVETPPKEPGWIVPMKRRRVDGVVGTQRADIMPSVLKASHPESSPSQAGRQQLTRERRRVASIARSNRSSVEVAPSASTSSQPEISLSQGGRKQLTLAESWRIPRVALGVVCPVVRGQRFFV